MIFVTINDFSSYFFFYYILFKNLVIIINPTNKTITDFGELIIRTNRTKKCHLISIFIQFLLIVIDLIILSFTIESRDLIIPYAIILYHRIFLNILVLILSLYN